jgi:hypothetical protein
MTGLSAAKFLRIHILICCTKDVDARHIGERSDAVLRTAMAGHDGGELGAIFGSE